MIDAQYIGQQFGSYSIIEAINKRGATGVCYGASIGICGVRGVCRGSDEGCGGAISLRQSTRAIRVDSGAINCAATPH